MFCFSSSEAKPAESVAEVAVEEKSAEEATVEETSVEEAAVEETSVEDADQNLNQLEKRGT